MVVDRTGLVVFHPDESIMLAKNVKEIQGWGSLARGLQSGEAGGAAFTHEGDRREAAYFPAALNGWMVVASMSETDFLAEANALKAIIWIVMVAIIGLSLAALILLARSIAKPLNAAIGAIVPDIKRTAELVQEIASASREQSLGIEQVQKAMTQLDTVIQQNASASEEMAGMAEELSGESSDLKSTIAYFKQGGRVEAGVKDRDGVKEAAAPLLKKRSAAKAILLVLRRSSSRRLDATASGRMPP